MSTRTYTAVYYCSTTHNTKYTTAHNSTAYLVAHAAIGLRDLALLGALAVLHRPDGNRARDEALGVVVVGVVGHDVFAQTGQEVQRDAAAEGGGREGLVHFAVRKKRRCKEEVCVVVEWWLRD